MERDMATIFRNFWGKKKKKTPETLTTEEHGRASTILTRLRDLTGEAETAKVTLHGTLEGKRASIVQAVRENRFDDGEQQMVRLRNEFDSTVTDKNNWEKKKNDYDDTDSKLTVLKNWDVPGSSRLADAFDALNKRKDDEDFHNASQLLGVLHPKVVKAHTDATNKRAAQVQFNNAFNTFRGNKLAHPDFLPSPDPGPVALKNERDGIERDLDAVIAERDKTEYGNAEGLLPALGTRIDNYIRDRKAYVTARDKFLGEEQPIMTRAAAIAGMDDDIPDDKRLIKQEVVTIKGQIETDKTNFAYGAAQLKLDDLKNTKLGPIETFKGQHDTAKANFTNIWKSYKYTAEEVKNYPTRNSPQSLKDLQKDVKDEYDPIVAALALRDYIAAEARIADLKQAVDDSLQVKRAFDREVRAYYAALKPLRPRIAAADKVVAPEAPQDQIDDFTNAKKEMVDAQDDRDYAEANRKMKPLVDAIDPLLASRKAALLQAIDDTDDPAVAGDNIKKLAPEEIVELGAKKQAQYLKKLRTGTDGNPRALTDAEKEARNHLYMHIQLDPKFVKEDKKKRDKIVKLFQKDKKFKQARDNWKDMGDDEKKKFLAYAVKVQCKVMGHPEPEINLVSERMCKNEGPPQCVDYRVKKDSSLLPPCPTCGDRDNVGFSYGGCSGEGGITTDPAKIKINTVPEAGWTDFAEQLDSIMHENAHAYQMYVAYELMDKTPPGIKEDDPNYDQAMLFWENEIGAGYQPPGEDCYDTQPLERHAWAFGPAIRNGTVGPKVTVLAEGDIEDDEDV
jgi:hypothetical protein